MCVFDMRWSRKKLDKGTLLLVLGRAGGIIILQENPITKSD